MESDACSMQTSRDCERDDVNAYATQASGARHAEDKLMSTRALCLPRDAGRGRGREGGWGVGETRVAARAAAGGDDTIVVPTSEQ
jgi:hypothetical protein